MAVGLEVDKVSMTGMCNVTHLKIRQHQTQNYVNYEEIHPTAQIPRKSSSRGIAKIGYCIKKDTIIQYFSNLNFVSELQDLELNEKSDPKFAKFEKSNTSTTATVS